MHRCQRWSPAASVPALIHIRLNISCESETILADLTELNQVLMNLSTNATHGMGDEAGILERNLEPITLDTDSAAAYDGLAEGNFVKFIVKDTRHGIDPVIKDRIFYAYFSTKNMADTLGMGLAIVYGIVKRHGGAVAVESQPGKGTVFEVLFPVLEKDVEPEIKKEPELSPKGTERIFFVDDEAPVLKVFKRVFERHGYKVTTSANSPEALEHFKTEPDAFDLVITDMAMPHMAGDQLAQELPKIRPDIPIIICTGHTDRLDENAAKAIGIKAFVYKPLLMKDISRLVRNVLDGEIAR